MRSTRLVYNSIVSYEWAKWANEYALLKIKNHSEWFSDSVTSSDFDSNLLAKNIWMTNTKDQQMTYEIINTAKSYSWSLKEWEFDIIPMFIDEWELIQNSSKNPNKTTENISKALTLNLSWDNEFSWNIIWNDSVWDTYWVSWSWMNLSLITQNSLWISKKTETDANLPTWTKKLTYENIKIWDFLNNYSSNYLVIYNTSNAELTYSISSNENFALPKLKIIWSSKIWDFRQNIEFVENKNKYFDSLKYSIYNR